MYCTVRGKKCFVSTGSREMAADAPCLLFIHGSGQNHLTWLLQTRFFANRGWGALAPDLPGHGLSEGAPLKTIEEMADWCHEFLCEMGYKTATVIGHSQGGLISLEFCHRHPDQTSALAIIASAAAIEVNPQLISMAKKDEAAAIEAMVAWGHGVDGRFHDHAMPGNSHLNLGRRVMTANPAGTLAVDLHACALYQNGIKAAESITAPSLLILARDDRMTPLKSGKILSAAISGAETKIIDKAGHMLPIERGHEVNAGLRALLARAKIEPRVTL